MSERITWSDESRERFPDHWLEGELYDDEPSWRFNWPLLGCLIFCVLFWLAVGVTAAKAAGQDPRLNAVASAVAGHPVIVSCADSEHEWVQFEDTAGLTFETDGFTFPARDNVVFLAPRICGTLLADLAFGPTVVGDYMNALAIKTIIHESVHQRGVYDEGVTDCTALSLVRQYAVSSFGYAPTVTKQVIAKHRVAGKLVPYVKTVTVKNPALDSLYSWAVKWHRALPASYQGTC